MTRTMKSLLAVLGFAAFATTINVAPAQASDYCREYTRTVYIGNRTQEAYGNACLQPDGSWMIVGEGLGNDIPASVNDVDYVIYDDRQVVRPTRVVYYNRPNVIYRSQPSFVWTHNGYYRGNNYYTFNRNVTYRDHHGRDWRRNDRHDNGRHRGWDRDRDRGHHDGRRDRH